MIVSPAFSGKRYAVLGLARSGLAVVDTLLASGAQVVAWDRQDNAREKVDGRTRLADPLEVDLTGFDGVVVSPGVPLNTHPIAERAARFAVPVIGDIELFALARGDLPRHKVVGITGTNGKSTTTALIHHILESAGIPARMGGNIGLPILAQEPLPEGGVYVLELSSYQIDLTRSLDCDMAVLLNVTPDHLDRYENFDAYAASKARLFSMQTEKQLAVVEYTAEADLDVLDDAPDGLNVLFIDKVALPGSQADWPALQGPHNLENARAAVAVCRALGVADSDIGDALATFRGLPHRMEVVAEHRGVLFVNDSKATNQASAAPALAAYPPDPFVEGGGRPRIHWIVGGLPKEDGLGECEQHLANIAAAYTIGEAGPRFAQLLEGRVRVERAELMCQALRLAYAAVRPGDVVLLSPACASFDQFRDYEKRGEYFREIVAMLIGDAAPSIDCAAGKSAA